MSIPSNHWARQHKDVCLETTAIVEHLKDQTPFSEWSDYERKVFSYAAFPGKVTDEDGRWTVEGRHALNMIRHLFQRGNFMTAPAVIRQCADSLSDDDKRALALAAFNLRMELPLVTPPWIAGEMFSESA